jgi:serine/threonine protein kinase
MPSDYDALIQMTRGLHHIHNNNFIHRDIKPENILISLPSADGVQLKISDFGLCKPVSLKGSASMSAVKGTRSWLAPELLKCLDMDPEQFLHQSQNISTDIFALGCVFYYYLTRGFHPFGEVFYLVMPRIAEGKFDLTGTSQKIF